MLYFLFLNSVVILGAVLLASRAFKLNTIADFLIGAFVIYFSQIVLTELILGLSGALYLNNLIVLNIAVFFVIWLACRKKKSCIQAKGIRERASEILSSKVVLLLTAIILGFGLIKVFINLTNPPFGWDDLNYHFTFAVEWLKQGNLNTPITISDDPAPTYYPVNGSLSYLWLILPLKNVFLADLGQIPFFILAFLSVYSLSRKLELERGVAFIAACLFTIIPNYFKQLQIAYVDVMVAALFLACLNFLFSLYKQMSLKNTLIFSACLGLLIGTKTIALLYGGLLFVPFLYLVIRNMPRAFVLLVVSILIMAMLGGFGYIRNFIETGNPLYPVDVKIFGQLIFKGVLDSNTAGAHFKPEDYRLTKLLFHEGLGVQTLLFIFPFVFLGLPVVWLRKRKHLNFLTIYFLLLPLLFFVIYRYIIPLANTRYLYPLLGCGIIAGFFTINILRVPRILISILVVISALASMSELAKRQELASGIILTFILFFMFLFSLNLIKKAFSNRALAVSLCAVIFLSLIWLNHDYERREYHRYIKMVKYSGFWPDAAKAWDWLNTNTKGDNIAYVGRPVPFPLYGSHFKNNVFYVSVNKTDPAKLHYFPNSRYSWGSDFASEHASFQEKNNYRGNADYDVWSANLGKRDCDYLFVYSLHQTKEVSFPLEDGWAKAHPDKFDLNFANSIVHIYKVIK